VERAGQYKERANLTRDEGRLPKIRVDDKERE
jgi:hypothetical protein